ncbi:hypothetical protein GALL_363310 [mine drainage metagenome]|uniref:Uncharacterized protein n=1 Tax=mine drainage metagenome TaxID=410659 RepID=A0A1J5QPM1_9ZZZZ
MSFWPIAATAPRYIEATDNSAMICPQSPGVVPKAPTTTRAIIAIAATFGAVAKNAVTGVGEPS